LPANRDDGDVDVGKNVDGRAENDDRRGDQDEQREHDECVWPVESDSDNPHDSMPLLREKCAVLRAAMSTPTPLDSQALLGFRSSFR
jgi:hypothetical protein